VDTDAPGPQENEPSWFPHRGERVIVRETVPRWAGQTGTVTHLGPAAHPRPVTVLFPDEDERDFHPDELAPAEETRS
jgi:hypothetical protein